MPTIIRPRSGEVLRDPGIIEDGPRVGVGDLRFRSQWCRKTTTIRRCSTSSAPRAGDPYSGSSRTRTRSRSAGRLHPRRVHPYDRLTGGRPGGTSRSSRRDRAYQASLIERFGLDPSRRFREYSKGNKQKVGVIIALQHRPELLSSTSAAGLDPFVQQTFFSTLRETVPTAPLSSSPHPVRVEKSCERVAIIREDGRGGHGRGAARRWHHQVELRFTGPVPLAEFAQLPGVSDVVGDDRARMRVSGDHAGRPGGGPHEPDFVSRGRASRRHSWRSTAARPSR